MQDLRELAKELGASYTVNATLEDPIEYLHPSKQCVVNQRQVGPHTGSFARALRRVAEERLVGGK